VPNRGQNFCRAALGAKDVTGTDNLIRTIKKSAITSFTQSAWSGRRGVYVFGIRKQGGSVTPWYVGLADKQKLCEEATSKDKLRKYAAAMFGRTGKPNLTLVVAPAVGPEAPVDDLETLLIWIARARNPKLLNERKVGSAPKNIIRLVNRIQISGVLNMGKGTPSHAALAFRRMMGLGA
jgi:hypothetical protein